MKKTQVLQEIRKMRFKDIYEKRAHKRLTIEQAADLLGVHERTFRRWSVRYEEEGAEGLADQRLDKVAHNAAPVDEVMALTSLYKTRYSGWNVNHFYDRYPLMGRAILMEHHTHHGLAWPFTSMCATLLRFRD